MIINHFMQVSKLTNDCPSCGSDKLGNGQGALIVDENIYKRTCKCGFNFEYDTNNGTTRGKVQKAIKQALEAMGANE